VRHHWFSISNGIPPPGRDSKLPTKGGIETF
jgi:hypothetical protein